AEKSGDTERANETIQRPGSDGRFVEAIRQVTVTTKAPNGSREETTTYEPDMNGALELARQSVSSSTKHLDGSEVTEVNLYARSAGGQAQTRGDALQIREQQIIERTPTDDGSVVERLSVRRPSLAEPGRLGALQKLSEKVCTGNCK